MVAFALAANLGYLALLQHLTHEEEARQRAVVVARQYHDGLQLVKLTERLIEFLGDDSSALRLRLNICKTVVNAVTERLILTGLDIGTDNKEEAQRQREWALNVYKANRLDIRQENVHAMAVRDGEAFIVLEWGAEGPEFYPQPRFTSTDVEGGDSYGCKAFYRNDDPDQTLLYVTKRWTEAFLNAKDERDQRQRMTVYWPDKIEKFSLVKGEWTPFRDPGDQGWPLLRTDAGGKPLGIPVVHVRNPDEACEAWEAIPLQKAINKSLVDVLAASDATAFQIIIAMGWSPFDAEGEPLIINPGQIIGTTAKPSEASATVVPPADLSGPLALLAALVNYAAMVTDTPVSRFQVTRQIAAEGTLKEQQGTLITKVEKRQALFGNAWERLFGKARRLQNTYGNGADGIPLDEEAMFTAQWTPAAPRSEQEVRDDLAFKRSMGVPEEDLWREMGYSEGDITRMARTRQTALAAQSPAPNTVN